MSAIVYSCPHLPVSLSAALSPEEAESALEATHYFTEDSSSGECCWPWGYGLGPHSCAVLLWGPHRRPAALGGLRACAVLGESPGVFSLLFLLSLPSWTLASLPLSSTSPPLSLPASPLASDLELFPPWEAQGQSLGIKVTRFVLSCVFLTLHCMHGQEAWIRLVPLRKTQNKAAAYWELRGGLRACRGHTVRWAMCRHQGHSHIAPQPCAESIPSVIRFIGKVQMPSSQQRETDPQRWRKVVDAFLVLYITFR